MGANTSQISNKTERPLYVVIRDGVQLVHRYTTEYRQVPDNGTPITITGLPVGGAIQVAVLYNVFADNKTFVCDLFRVPHQSELVVEVMTQGAGVTSFSGEGVTMVTKGMTIPLELPQGIIEDVKAVAPFVAGALGVKS